MSFGNYGNVGDSEVASLRAQVAQLQQQLQMQGGGAFGGYGGFPRLPQPSMGMMGGMGMGGYFQMPYIQTQQGGGGLINKVNSISLGDNFSITEAHKIATQTWTEADYDAGRIVDADQIGALTTEAKGMQKILGIGEASAKAQSVANGVNITGAVVGAGCAIAGTIANAVIQDKMIRLQEKYMNKMENLAEKHMLLQERGMEINQEIMEGKQNTVVQLAEIQAEVAKFQIKKSAEVSIQNTKTAAAYGWVNGQLYGNPAKKAGFQYKG